MDKEDVKFTGKEYLDYLRYEDTKNKKRNMNRSEFFIKHKYVIGCGILSLGFALWGAFLYNAWTYIPPTPSPYTPFQNILMMISVFMGLSLSLSWIVHGAGFTIIGKMK